MRSANNFQPTRTTEEAQSTMANVMETQALNRFLLENNIQTVDPAVDNIYKFDAAQYQKILQDKPWTREYVHYDCVQ